jgi:thioredoxin reductase (NADPH)
MERLVIIGSGPAGLTAAIYAARANLQPLVYAGYLAGGQLMITSDVENYPGFADGVTGPELMGHFRKQAERFGARIIDIDVDSVAFGGHPFEITAGDESVTARSVVIATGASARWLDVPGEARLQGRGVSACATCDGAFFKEKRLTVIGGGDSAMEEALFLTRFASEVTVIHRGETLRASKIMAERALSHPKIRFIWNRIVESVEGNEHVEAVVLRDVKSSVTERFATDGMFVAIGHVPNTSIFQGQIHLDTQGYIQSQDGVHTNIPGVFTAGDVNDLRYKQAITAAGAGCKAAIEAERYLEGIEHPITPQAIATEEEALHRS